jgi:hypothetical protein
MLRVVDATDRVTHLAPYVDSHDRQATLLDLYQSSILHVNVP